MPLRLLIFSLVGVAAQAGAQGLTLEAPLFEPPSYVVSGQSVESAAITADATGNRFVVGWVDLRSERRLMLTRTAPSMFLPEPREGVRLDTAANPWPLHVSICFDGVTGFNAIGWVVYQSAPPNKPPVVVALRVNKDTLARVGNPILVPPLSPGNAQSNPEVTCFSDRAYVAFSELAGAKRLVRAALLQTSQDLPASPLFAVDAGALDAGVTPAVALAVAQSPLNRVGLAFTAPEGQSLLQLDTSLSQVLARSPLTPDRLTPAAVTADGVSFHAASSSLPILQFPEQARVFPDGGVVSYSLNLSGADYVVPGATTHALRYDGSAVRHLAVVHNDSLRFWGTPFAPDFTVSEVLRAFIQGESGSLATLPGSVAATLLTQGEQAAAAFDPRKSSQPSVVSTIATTQRWPVASRGGVLAWSERLDKGFGVFAARLSPDAGVSQPPMLLCPTQVEVLPQLAQRGERTLLWWAESPAATRAIELPQGTLSPGCGTLFPTGAALLPGTDEGVLAVSRSPLRLLDYASDGTLRDGGAPLPTAFADEAALAATDGGALLAWVYNGRLLGGRVDGALPSGAGLGESLTAGSRPRALALTATRSGALLLVVARLPNLDAPERLYAQSVGSDGRGQLPLEVPVADTTLGTGVLHDDGRRVWAAWQEPLDGGARWRAIRLSDRAEVLDSEPLELFRSRDTLPGLAITGAGPVSFAVSRRDPDRLSERLALRSYLGKADGERCASTWDCASAVCAQGTCCATPCAGACVAGSCQAQRPDAGADDAGVDVDAGAPDAGARDGGVEQPDLRGRSALGCQCSASGGGAAPVLLGLMMMMGGRWRRLRSSR